MLDAFLNKVYLGDVMDLLKQLPDNSVDCVFADPDYNVGIKYGKNNYKMKFDAYIKWYGNFILECLRVLKIEGNLFTINYPKQNAHLRVKYLDDGFNVDEIVWVYNTNVGQSRNHFTTAHRSILHVTKSDKNVFYKDNIALPYKNPTDKRVSELIKKGSKGRMPYSWVNLNLVKNVSKEKTFHSCQLPQLLSELFIKSSTQEGDSVLIPFGGSGAELLVCKDSKRNFISAEIYEPYYNMIQSRLSTNDISDEFKLKRKVKMINEEVVAEEQVFTESDTKVLEDFAAAISKGEIKIDFSKIFSNFGINPPMEEPTEKENIS